MASEPLAEPDAPEEASATPAVHYQSQRGKGGFAVLRALRHREFGIFWIGQAISLVGTWMQGFAQGWVVADMTTSAIALGLVNFASSIPTLLLMPLGGVAADRMDRRQILIYCQWMMLVLAVVMGALVARGELQLWHIYVVALLLGAVTAYDLPAYQSFYPQLVEREDLPQAISLNQATFHGSRIIGPALAAAVVAAWGTASAFFANAASFLAVIASLLLIRRRAPAASTGASTSGMMAEGFRYVRERPDLQSLLGVTALTTLFIFPNVAVLSPYYVKHVLRLNAGALGTLMSISGAGALLGAAMLLSVARERRVLHIVVSVVTVVLTTSAMAWAQGFWVAVAAFAIQSIAIAHSLGLVSIILQERVPDELRGRVMSLYSLTFTGIMPFGSLLIPRVVDWIGMRVELQIAAVLYAVGVGLLLTRLIRQGSSEPAAEPGGA